MPSINPYDKVDQGLEKLLQKLLPNEYMKNAVVEMFNGTFSFWAVSCKDLTIKEIVGTILDLPEEENLVGLEVFEAIKLLEDSERAKVFYEEIKSCAATGIPVCDIVSYDNVNIEKKITRVGKNGRGMCIVSFKVV